MIDRIVWRLVYGSLVLLALLIGFKAHAQQRADICMAVGLDASGSIHNEEMRLQLDGLAAALRHPRFARAIRSGGHRLIAITVYSWADSLATVEVIVPWHGMRSDKDTHAVADQLSSWPTTHRVRSTSLLVAIQAGAAMLADCPWFADRQLLNVAGDGYTNVGPGPANARTSAVDRGIVINGLVVGQDANTITHYETEVVGPPLIGFAITVDTYEEFSAGMLRKLLEEIAAR